MQGFLEVIVMGDATEYKRAMGEAGGATSSFGSHFSGIGRLVKAGGMAIAAGLAVVVGAAADSVKTLETSAEATYKFQLMTGMSTKTSAAFVEVAKVHDVNIKSIGMSTATTAKQVEAANKGSAASVALFDRLGVSQAALKSKNMDAVFNGIAKGLGNETNATQRLNDAHTLFGRNYQFMLQIMGQGEGEYKRQMGLASQFADALGTGGVNAAKKAIDSQREMTISLDTIKVAFAEKILPILMKGVIAVTGWVQSLKGGANEVGKYVTDTIGGHTKLSQVLEQVYTVIKGYVTEFISIIKEIGPTVLTMVQATGGPLLMLVKLFSDNKTALELLLGAYVAGKVVMAAWSAAQTFNNAMVAIGIIDQKAYAVAMEGATIQARIATVATEGFTAAMTLLDAALMVSGIVILIAALVLLVMHWREVTDIWRQDAQELGGVFGTMANAIVAPFVGAFNVLKDGFKAAINWIIGAWDALKFTVPHINLGPLGTIGGGTVGVNNIPLLMAHGGMSPPGGRWATVGERGPEKVFLPGGSRVFSNQDSAGVGGNQFTFNVHNTGEQLDEHAIAREAAFRLATT